MESVRRRSIDSVDSGKEVCHGMRWLVVSVIASAGITLKCLGALVEVISGL